MRPWPLLALCLIGCTAQSGTSSEPSQEDLRVETPPSTLPPAQALPSAPALTVVNYDLSAVATRAASAICTITRSDPVDVALERVRSSSDGQNHIHGDAEAFRGGDHNVFGEVDGIFAPGAGQAAILTPDATYHLDSDPAFGMFVTYTNDGEAHCAPIRPRHDAVSMETLAGLVHDETVSEPQIFTGRSRVIGGCLAVLDEADIPYLAVLPERLEPLSLLNALREPTEAIDGDTGRLIVLGGPGLRWFSPDEARITGRRVALKDPVKQCPEVTDAVLMSDMPEVDLFGLSYPRPPRTD